MQRNKSPDTKEEKQNGRVSGAKGTVSRRRGGNSQERYRN